METANIFNYNNTNITFRNQLGEVFVNATEMAKPFNKRPAKWLELPSSKSFLKEIQAIRLSDRSTLISSENGVATWFHEDVAIEFARWLSPAFAIWCNNHIKQLVKQGYTHLDSLTTEQLLQLLVSRVQLSTIIQPTNNVQPTQYHPINLKGWQWEGNKRLEYIYTHLLLNACKTTKMVKGIELERGQMRTTMHPLAKDLKISYESLRHAIDKLVSSGELTKQSKDRNYSLFTITNFNKYVGI